MSELHVLDVSAFSGPFERHAAEPTFAGMSRDAFGHWLAGFTDGEGCFYLGLNTGGSGKKYGLAHFTLTLRADEMPILQTIKQRLGCGNIYFRRISKGERKSAASYAVVRQSDLTGIIVPFFERYSLRAKKARDFAIWKRGVQLITNLKRSPVGRNPCKWTPDVIETFKGIISELRQVREYDDSHVPVDEYVGRHRGSPLGYLDSFGPRSDNSSGYKGVYPKRKRWSAKIHVNGKNVNIGCFATKEEAARAYDAAALLYHGSDTHLNFPSEVAS